jgi:hypothetical protein
MVNTKTMGHVFRHPKYYKQLKRNMKKKRQASSIKLETTIWILHEEWALKQGSRLKHQAASFKRQAASFKHVPRYVASDYKATSIKRQASIPPNKSNPGSGVQASSRICDKLPDA